jgi:hypothetical protein
MMLLRKSLKVMAIWHKLVRGALLSLMILLAGVAPLLTVAVDNDDDDDTPPITVEMNLDAPSREAAQIPAIEIAQQFTVVGNGDLFGKAALSSQHHSMIHTVTGSPQLVVPLRT